MVIASDIIGQTTSQFGRYEVDFSRGCAPLTVTITEIDSTSGTRQYTYFEDGNLTNELTFTYQDPGVYTITQYTADSNQPPDTLGIEVLEVTSPTFDIFNCEGNSARIIATDGLYDYYQLFYLNDSITFGPNTISEVFSFPDQSTQTLQLRGYYNDAFDNCGEVTFSFTPTSQINNPVIDNISFEKTCADLIDLTLNLTIQTDVRHLIEFSEDGSTFNVLDTIYNEQNPIYQDVSVSNSNAIVRISAIEECTGSLVYPFTFTINDLNPTLDPIVNITASYTGKRPVLTYDTVSISTISYNIYRQINQGDFDLVGESTSNTFSDNNLNPDINLYNYQVISTDSCGNSSGSSIIATPVYLQFDKESPNIYQLEWNEYSGWQSGINFYQLDILSSENLIVGTLDFDTPSPRLLNISNFEGNKYRISIYSSEGSYVAYSNIILLNKEKIVLFPDAFSPNADGVNDTFGPIITEANNYTLLIYSKWGELIFRSSSPANTWDGKYKGFASQPGTYFYRITFENDSGEKFDQSGSFLLLR